GREVTARRPFAPAGGGLILFTANRDGSLSVLLPQADGARAAEQAMVVSAGLADPSALAVLQASDGAIEVYVTDAGESGVVVLRFGPEDLFAGAGDFGGGVEAVLVPVGGDA